MTTDPGESEITTMSPDDAFTALGNEMRMDVLWTLAEADEPLAFSELYDRVAVDDSGQFSYHLDKLVGHFVRKTEDVSESGDSEARGSSSHGGYVLARTGRRVIEAVLSGTVTEVPDLEPTEVDWPCPYCGAPTEVVYDESTPFPVKPYCTDCAGLASSAKRFDHGQLGALRLAPAGIRGRTPEELLEAAVTWTHIEILSVHSGVCPYCSGRIDHSVRVCETHDAGDGVCGDCDRTDAVRLSSHCTNCIFETGELFAAQTALSSTELLAFLTAHGVNPLTDSWGPVLDTVDEEVLSTDPFEARFTFTIDDDALVLTVDEDLSVVDVAQPAGSDPG